MLFLFLKERGIISRRSIGVDIGSVGAKGVLFDGGVAATALLPTGWDIEETGQDLLSALTGGQRDGAVPLVATGYGRNAVAGADRKVTEITCHGRGVRFLAPQARTVLDIGGQDSKVIRLDETGNVIDFAMNDRCAAGTGRFLQMMAHSLGYGLDGVRSLPPDGEVQPLSSMCAVFAETEVVAHIARGVAREALLRGILQAIASRSAAMVSKTGLTEPLFFSGGLSRVTGLAALIGRELRTDVIVHDRAPLAGALGAALIAWEAA
ncbi:2-hydroxyglutaryl-CoA dehydratase [Aminithiophilus ramosus]|uniref:2-hydroxyglutaryl-CoA dehydratase n=1 Tax=Aminithiophilus ramosus TaxID=3029084 RepID=A0A9Q7ADN4_9BACT|nr:acyl-CoA dehydratase activase [Aminithiophilus ramosus]QTX32883.1 2-hydroxyglutaryl-CoA dehydratase [Aminithiophilus ramosus]